MDDIIIPIEENSGIVKSVEITGINASKLFELALSFDDLEVAWYAIAKAEEIGESDSIVKELLWKSAVLHYIKCFGGDRRNPLILGEVYGTAVKSATECHEYFKLLRNKFLIHDENVYTMGGVTALINDGTKINKIERIDCNIILSQTSDSQHIDTLKMLISTSLKWVDTSIAKLKEDLRLEFELKSYAELAAYPGLTIRVPLSSEVTKKR